jgi:hypothetical protein
MKGQAMNPANLRTMFSFLALILLCTSATAQGEEAAGVYFQHGDWEIACDNTLTFRMADYCAEEDFATGCASVLITCAAGHDAPLFFAREVLQEVVDSQKARKGEEN